MSDFLIANHTLLMPDPDVQMIATGGWNQDGSPKTRKASRTIPPAAVFPVAWLAGGSAEATALVEAGAAHWPDEAEAAALGAQQPNIDPAAGEAE